MNLPNTFNLTGNNTMPYHLCIAIISALLLLNTSALAATKANDEKNSIHHSKTDSKTTNKNNDDTKTYPINVSADQLISQTKGGHSEYKGNVLLERNKLSVQGDSLKIIHPQDKLQQAIMTGSPAKFKDYLPKKQQWVNGEAKQIVFNQEKDTITLQDNAMMIMDNGNEIRAEKIVIYNKDETFEANGNKQSGRVKMTIQPDN